MVARDHHKKRPFTATYAEKKINLTFHFCILTHFFLKCYLELTELGSESGSESGLGVKGRVRHYSNCWNHNNEKTRPVPNESGNKNDNSVQQQVV